MEEPRPRGGSQELGATLGIGVASTPSGTRPASTQRRPSCESKVHPPKYLPAVKREQSRPAAQETETRLMRVLQCTKRSVTLMAAACIVLFFVADKVTAFLAPIAGGGP